MEQQFEVIEKVGFYVIKIECYQVLVVVWFDRFVENLVDFMDEFVLGLYLLGGEVIFIKIKNLGYVLWSGGIDFFEVEVVVVSV